MALRLALRRSTLRAPLSTSTSRTARSYATVQPHTFAGEPPRSPDFTAAAPPVPAPSGLDALILSELRRTPTASLPLLVRQFDDHSGRVLNAALKYESRPRAERKVQFSGNDNSVVMIAHAVQDAPDRHKVSVCSGFALNVPRQDDGGDQSVFVTCAHTLQEVNRPRSSRMSLTGLICRCDGLHYSLLS